MEASKSSVCIVGLGYVGLPLAIEFGKKVKTIGFDINKTRIKELKLFNDSTLEVERKDFIDSTNLEFITDINEAANCNVYIVTVPTPIDLNKKPDLSPLKSATEIVSSVIKKGDFIIFESTVYPGATEEVCLKIIEEKTDLKLNKDFFLGYSPERINPGDKEHRLSNIVKVTSGSNEYASNCIDNLYSLIIDAGTYKASSIRVAEAAKVIENTQRDLNIGLINELSKIFNLLEIDTEEVLLAAGTKWNFLPFRPGLVGGHCIGVDPYYLTHKAQEIGYEPNLILAARKINDEMPKYVVKRLSSQMLQAGKSITDSNILVLGLTFKENCPDTRNSKVFDIIEELKTSHAKVSVYDPYIDKESSNFNNINLITEIDKNLFDAVIICVAHNEFISMGIKTIKSFLKSDGIVYDLKFIFEKHDSDLRL